VAYAYDPYGADTITAQDGFSASRQNAYLFASGIQDRTTGWVKYGQRFYDPGAGRWTQQDTIDAPLDPANGNRYTYAGGDPVNNLDPTGRNLLTDIVDLVGACLVGAAFVGSYGAAVGAITGVGAIGGAAVGFIYGCGAAIISQGTLRYNVVYNPQA